MQIRNKIGIWCILFSTKSKNLSYLTCRTLSLEKGGVIMLLFRIAMVFFFLWSGRFIILCFYSDDAPDQFWWNFHCVLLIVSAILFALSFLW